MELFNASSLFHQDAQQEVIRLARDPARLEKRLSEAKELLLEAYRLTAYQLPEDFATRSYIIAANHLTDTDAPLFMSYYHRVMNGAGRPDSKLFVFAKENCFNGVSITQELLPILAHEQVVAVDRHSVGGSMAAMRTASRWFAQGEGPKHFLIFAQGTIYDINRDMAEDIEPGAFWLARRLGVPVLPAFLEQAVEGQENRLIFGEPIPVAKGCRDFEEVKQLWLDRVVAAQRRLEALTGTPARPADLDAAHRVRKRFGKPGGQGNDAK